jgi:hypothetical protein
MKRRIQYLSAAIIIVSLAVMMLASCHSQKAIDPDIKRIEDKTEELFTRSKVLDYNVLYESEFPYMRDETPLEEYLKNRYIQWGRIDTLAAMQIDSATIFGDSAYVYLQIEYILSDSSLSERAIPFIWYRVNDTGWAHPVISNLQSQKEYEEEIKMYWDAVHEMQKEQGNDSASQADSSGN